MNVYDFKCWNQNAQQWRSQPPERIAWSLDHELNDFVYKHQGTEGRSNIAFAGIGSRNRSKVDLNDKIGLTVRFVHSPKATDLRKILSTQDQTSRLHGSH